MEWNGHPVTPGGKKLRELLALLTYYQGAPKTKRQLAVDLWPDSTAGRARDCLYKVLRDLRRLQREVPLPFFETRDGLYLDLTEEQSDLSLFQKWSCSGDPESWTRAFELYRGGFLDKEAYEWTTTAHSYYEIRFLNLIQALAQHCRSLGREAEAKYYQKLAEAL